MPDPIHVNPAVVVPAEALEMRAVRAAGPGGQNVNKVASKIELRVDLQRIRGMDAGSRARLLRLVERRLDRTGRLVVTSQRSRDQSRNLEDARRKIRDWIALALVPEKKRIATRAHPAARARRLEQKRRIARLKRSRHQPGPADE